MTKYARIKLRNVFRPVFADCSGMELKKDDKVVLETEKGELMGKVLFFIPDDLHTGDNGKKPPKIIRKANEDDLRQEDLNERMEKDYFKACKNKILKHKLPMKLVGVEIEADGSKVIFYFTADNRIDFRALVKELAADFRTRIEMRQIGARSETQKFGGLGCCGRSLCCASFLNDFKTITVKMTKEQNLPLDPEKISGVCGRLMCCLEYEYETYVALKEGLPKVGKKIRTPKGVGKVKHVNVISNKISVELEDSVVIHININEYKSEMLVKDA